MYEYRVEEIIKIYDGDTITVKLSLGFNVTKIEVLRLAYIDTPELRNEEYEAGIISRDWLRERLNTAMKGTGIRVKTLKDHKGKYGRYIATIYVDGVNINKQMLAEGLATVYE
ncbi:MAG: thermonuclease family protein [Clostridiales bacterium]|nr:thermonuclease family protein [Clostridiales bacterium]